MEKDERFKHIATDPKFRRIPKLEKKVKIDKRFHGMFKDERFKVKYTVDKRGRPINHSSNNDLRRYYELSSSESDNEGESDNNESSDDEETEQGKFVRPKSESEEDEVNKDLKKREKGDKKISDAVKKKLKNLHVDYARGEERLVESSSDDDEESDEGTNYTLK